MASSTLVFELERGTCWVQDQSLQQTALLLVQHYRATTTARLLATQWRPPRDPRNVNADKQARQELPSRIMDEQLRCRHERPEAGDRCHAGDGHQLPFSEDYHSDHLGTIGM